MKRLLSVLIILSLLISLAGCKWFKKEKKPADTVKLNGVSITEYKIVCDKDGLDYNVRAAEYIRDSIAAKTGATLNIVDDSNSQAAREIVVGETSRPISAELNTDTVGFEFAMLAKDGTIALEADYFVIAAAAYYFVNTYVSGNDMQVDDGHTVRTPEAKEAKNFILLIGDGMGLYQTMLYDYVEDTTDYSDGENLFYGYMFPNFGASRTNSYSGTTDSAAGGTALSTGYKTINGYVGIDKNGVDLKTLTELAGEMGKATAVMSTEKSTGATPASFSAHEPSRDNSSEILADQTALTQKYGTVFSCNYDYYTERYVNNSIEKRITETLSTVGADTDGFFLMYEEAYIDKHSHNNDIEKTFHALIRFNQAIARFMEYAFYHPDTMVIITADHETGGLLPSQLGGLYYTSKDHTSADVPVFAWGKGTETFLKNNATVENIHIAQFIASMMGAENFGDRSGSWYTDIYPGGTELPIIPIN